MILETAALLLGSIGILVLAAEKLVITATRMAKEFEISELAIGLTILAIGTSIPEIAIGIQSAVFGNGSIGMANAIGSSLSTLGIALGIGILLRGQAIAKKDELLTQFFPLLPMFLVLAFSILSGTISHESGWMLLILFGIYVLILLRILQNFSTLWNIPFLLDLGNKIALPTLIPRNWQHRHWMDLASILAALTAVWIGSHYALEFSTQLATELHIEKTIIGFSLLAIASSLPEIAVSISTLHNRLNDAFVGNAIGSVITNTGLVIGLIATIHTIAFPVDLVLVPGFLLMVCCLLLFYRMYRFETVEKTTGIILFGLYLLSLGYLFFLA